MENYEVLGVLGEGTYGVVNKALHRPSGLLVAIKQFKEGTEHEQIKKTAIREIRILKQFVNDNIVALFDIFRETGRLFLVFEFVERSLLKDLESCPNGLDKSFVRPLLYQLLQALAFIHSAGSATGGGAVIHRDIKPENILLTQQGVLKLCDFGFARAISGAGAKYTDYVATRWYRAPELLCQAEYDSGVDIWAVGCLLCELLTGQPLFPGSSDLDQLSRIVQTLGPLPPHLQTAFHRNPLYKGAQLPEIHDPIPLARRFSSFSKNTFSLVSACLRYDPRERPSATKLLKHPFFSSSFVEHFSREFAIVVRRDREYRSRYYASTTPESFTAACETVNGMSRTITTDRDSFAQSLPGGSLMEGSSPHPPHQALAAGDATHGPSSTAYPTGHTPSTGHRPPRTPPLVTVGEEECLTAASVAVGADDGLGGVAVSLDERGRGRSHVVTPSDGSRAQDTRSHAYSQSQAHLHPPAHAPTHRHGRHQGRPLSRSLTQPAIPSSQVAAHTLRAHESKHHPVPAGDGAPPPPVATLAHRQQLSVAHPLHPGHPFAHNRSSHGQPQPLQPGTPVATAATACYPATSPASSSGPEFFSAPTTPMPEISSTASVPRIGLQSPRPRVSASTNGSTTYSQHQQTAFGQQSVTIDISSSPRAVLQSPLPCSISELSSSSSAQPAALPLSVSFPAPQRANSLEIPSGTEVPPATRRMLSLDTSLVPPSPLASPRVPHLSNAAYAFSPTNSSTASPWAASGAGSGASGGVSMRRLSTLSSAGGSITSSRQSQSHLNLNGLAVGTGCAAGGAGGSTPIHSPSHVHLSVNVSGAAVPSNKGGHTMQVFNFRNSPRSINPSNNDTTTAATSSMDNVAVDVLHASYGINALRLSGREE